MDPITLVEQYGKHAAGADIDPADRQVIIDGMGELMGRLARPGDHEERDRGAVPHDYRPPNGRSRGADPASFLGGPSQAPTGLPAEATAGFRQLADWLRSSGLELVIRPTGRA